MKEEELSLLDEIGSAWDEDPATEVDEDAVQQETEETEEVESSEGTEDLEVVSGEAEDTTSGEEELSSESDAPSLEFPDEAKGLPPEAREQWKNTPKAMQDAILKREQDYASGIEKHRTGAAQAEAMHRTIAPYQQYLAMSGQSPDKAIGSLLQTASLLQMGSPQQKAQSIAQLIGQFGIDIKTLDSMLVGEAPAVSDPVQQQIQQAIAPFQQREAQFQQQQQHQVQQQQQAIGDELTAFSNDPKNEFYNDVRMDMADIMEMAANRGRQITYPQAYQQACQIHPTIGPIMKTRENAGQVKQRQNAATSISGGKGGPGGGNQSNSMHDAISDAWANAGQV